MGTYGVQMKGVLPWLVRLACRASTRDFYLALIALVSPVQNIIFLAAHFVCHFMGPHRPGRQSCRAACLLIYVSGSCTRRPGVNMKTPPLYISFVQSNLF
jgi:hypothetical protein